MNDPPFLKNGYITFGSLNNFCKVNGAVLSLWAEVLHQVADSRMLILAPPGCSRERVLDRFTSAGVDAKRIEFTGHVPRAEYLRLYNRFDMGLDTFPYNGHATSFDSFWMGVPVVTLVGSTVVGRAGMSQLMNLNLPELIAHSTEQYLRIATALCEDRKRLIRLRRTLRDQMRESPLTDIRKFAAGMESIYWNIWKRNRAPAN